MTDELKPLKVATLSNGLTLEFFDESNRYFGDYWRVAVAARCRIAVSSVLPAGSPDHDQALALLGDAVLFAKRLEKMGVAGAEVDEARNTLIAQFLESAGLYLNTPDFALRFLRQQLAERKKGRRPFLVPK